MIVYDFDYKGAIEWIGHEFETKQLKKYLINEDEIEKPKVLGVGSYGIIVSDGKDRCNKIVVKYKKTVSEKGICDELLQKDNSLFSKIIVPIRKEYVNNCGKFLEIIYFHILALNLVVASAIPKIDMDYINDLKRVQRIFKTSIDNKPDVYNILLAVIERSPVPINLFPEFESVIRWANIHMIELVDNKESEIYIWNMPRYLGDLSDISKNEGPYIADSGFLRWTVCWVFCNFYKSIERGILLNDIKHNNILLRNNPTNKDSITLEGPGTRVVFSYPSKYYLKICDLQFTKKTINAPNEDWYNVLHLFILSLYESLLYYRIEDKEFFEFADSFLSMCPLCKKNNILDVLQQEKIHIGKVSTGYDFIRTYILKDVYFNPLRSESEEISVIPVLKNTFDIVTML